MVIGHPLLALSAERQVNAYLTRRDGLKSNGPDDGPRLDPIAEPVWPWPPVVDRRAEVKPDLNAAMASTKDALAKVAGRPRMRFQLERARKALSKARKINRG